MQEAKFEFQFSSDPSKTISIPVVQELAKSINGSDPVLGRYLRDVSSVSSVSLSVEGGTLPIIDMAIIASQDSDARHQEMQKLSAACQEWGFFQVINHGMPNALIEKMKKLCREFFDLPLEEKLNCRQAEDRQGYGQVFIESDKQILDWADMMYFRVFPIYQQNKEIWPQKPSNFRETLISYATEANKLSLTLFNLFDENLGLEAGTITGLCGNLATAVRINYYPPCPKPDQVLGLSPHSDAVSLTVLLQDGEAPGLQIRKNDEWFTVQPLPGALVVNIGDFIEVITNGIYKSIEHRAITSKYSKRISLATFCTIAFQEWIKPAPALLDEMHPPIYKEICVGDYLHNYFSKRLQGKRALSDYQSRSQ